MFTLRSIETRPKLQTRFSWLSEPVGCNWLYAARGRRATDCDFLCCINQSHLNSAGLRGHRRGSSCRGDRRVQAQRRASSAYLDPRHGNGGAERGIGQRRKLAEELFYLSGPRYDGVVPPCDFPDALVKISVHFNNKENTFWNTDLRIVAFEKVRETAFRAWAANAIPRRYCSGIVEISDGRKHPIHYSIGEDTGMVGATWGVEWCVVGLDRNWAYNPACQMARP